MANELNFSGTGGLTVVAEIYAANWVQQGIDIAMVEGAAGLYAASVPVAPIIADGAYNVLFRNTANSDVIGRGDLFWTDNAEIDLEHMNALLESDQSFDFGLSTLEYRRRTDASLLVPAKNVVGQTQTIDASITE